MEGHLHHSLTDRLETSAISLSLSLLIILSVSSSIFMRKRQPAAARIHWERLFLCPALAYRAASCVFLLERRKRKLLSAGEQGTLQKNHKPWRCIWLLVCLERINRKGTEKSLFLNLYFSRYIIWELFFKWVPVAFWKSIFYEIKLFIRKNYYQLKDDLIAKMCIVSSRIIIINKNWNYINWNIKITNLF